jgi:hypothetical protein
MSKIKFKREYLKKYQKFVFLKLANVLLLLVNIGTLMRPFGK